jgi:hypothetical protein
VARKNRTIPLDGTRQPPEPGEDKSAVSLKIPTGLKEALEQVALDLGMDVSNLIKFGMNFVLPKLSRMAARARWARDGGAYRDQPPPEGSVFPRIPYRVRKTRPDHPAEEEVDPVG